jgi:hypothetical protein
MKMKTLKEKIKKHKKKSVAIAIGVIAILGLSTSAICNNYFAAAATGNIDYLKWNLHLKPVMPEIKIERIMHEMTHQKVEAEGDKKWGAIPMCNDTIDQLSNYIWKSNYPKADKEYFTEMLDRWKKGDFADIARDHNELWGLEGGTIGYATGKATPEEESQFVLLHFGLHLPTY